MVDLVVRCSISSHDQKGNVGNDIEYKENNLEQREERVNYRVEGIPRDGKPFALHAVNPIAGEYTNHGRENKPGSVYDRAPHENSLERINIHDVPPFLLGIQRSNVIVYLDVKLFMNDKASQPLLMQTYTFQSTLTNHTFGRNIASLIPLLPEK